MKKKNNNHQDESPEEAVAKELQELKGLLVLLLMKSGATQGEIAKATKSSQSSVSRHFNFGDLKPFSTAIITDDSEEK